MIYIIHLLNKRVMGEIDMESLQFVSNVNNDLNIDDLLLETPIGWSSTCFDETIHYYTECNSGSEDIKNEDNQ
uniref:Uncharacterized protein n=1 Tax=Gracilaria vermiculophylla TaxID=2608709 RepID=A0A345U8W8_9FLOR|nr:hypothetical protein [Gracilaria vermiculophylla]AXI96904.1 hypothetical protein [Gracilaria vermiculophylla]WDZ68043.1 hypothetical protein [Gracilaria vermiculophylla]